jgi:hypothetical protein
VVFLLSELADIYLYILWRDDACDAVGVCVWYGIGRDLLQWGAQPAERGRGMLGWDEGGRVLSGRGDRFERVSLSRGGGACVYVVVTFFERRRA